MAAKKTAAPSRHSISAQLRDILEASGLSVHELARRSEVDRSAISRFLRADYDLRLGNVDRLAAALGLRLVEVGNRKRASTVRETKRPRLDRRRDVAGEEHAGDVQVGHREDVPAARPIGDEDGPHEPPA